MEKLQLHNTHSPLFAILFLLHFSSLQFLSLAYTPPTKYFINCGSASNVNAALRNFVGDSNSSDSISASVSLSGQSSTVNQSSGASPLYQTARIFRHNSSYEFNIKDPGSYFVRFHFFAFSSPTTPIDLSTALFDVSTSEFSLLLNFTPKSYSNSPILKEFLLTINPGKFKVYFVPRGSSFAFINAIEVFLAPPDLISDEAPLMHVSPEGLSNNNYTGVLSKSLQSIYRINVGGPALTPDDDTLWRNWVPDDGYIYNPDAAIDTPPHSGRPNYQGTITEFTAPYLVYQTAKQMNTNYYPLSFLNITWSFVVSTSAAHLVRFHFCDIISTSPATLKFNLYIYRNFGFEIDSHDYASQLNVPFYVDFVVDSDESGLMNVSIGTRNDFDQYNAYLNGLEIKEILHHSGSGSVHKNNHVFLVVGSVIGGSVLICILVVILFLVFKCMKPKHGKTSSLPSYLCRYFSLTEIRAATNNFDDVFIIGVGGFGNVYKGYIDDGATPVAIKRLNPGSQQGAHEFKTEIEMLSQLRHLNLVHLIGYCNHGREMILVYDYMTRGTLRDHLYNTDNPPLLWKQRLKICIGAAHGLNYLHTGAKQTIIHRDVKTTNILLDEKWVAKVSDFGLSKVGPNGMSKSHVSTVVKGSFGYLDPEYYRRQQLTEKSDVYSFGVVLCEVLCAKLPIMHIAETAVGLARWARENYRNGKVKHMVDPSLNGEIRTRCLKKFVEIAGKCLHEDRIERPSMNEVVRGLEFALQLQDSADEDVLLDVAETEAMDDERAHFPKSTLDDGDDMSSSGGQVSSTNSNSRVTIMSNSRVTSLGSNLNLGSKMPFAEIQFVTNNFDKKLVIGKGGFGIVYRGTFRDGKKVAVKRSKPGSNQGLLEFHTEIMVLSKIRHRNLVQLIGYCDERSEIILVYEFMEKGTLRDHLYASDKPPLSWKRRLEICMGAARGLQYLHKGSAGGIIHSDVKSTNILLDENHVAKVADFGLSKTGPLDETHVSTVVEGTFGYLDPEYHRTQQLTEKSDVYSFGVVLLEVLCARPPIDQTLRREQVNLAEWAMICKKKGLLEEIVDPSVKGQIDPNSIRKFIETTEKCLQDCGADRPNMVDVLWDLEYALQLQQNAMWRATLGQHNQFLGSIRDAQCSAVSFN